MEKFREALAALNWWSISAVLFTLVAWGLMFAPEWADSWALLAVLTAIVAAVLAVKEDL